MARKLVIGSRDSKLAVAQSSMVIDYIREHCPEIEASLLTMKTTGDINLNGPLYEIGGKGLFVKELDHALMDRRSDISVHSLKDMPIDIPKEIPIIGFSKREDPRDVLVLPKGVKDYDGKSVIGCSSLRRTLQLKNIFPMARVENIRGNLQTRLLKLDRGEYSALVLAAAGLKRIGLTHRINRYFEVEEMLPSAGQGILSVQGRAGEDYSFLEGFFDEDATYQAICERTFIRYVNGGCSSPIAAHAQINGENISLTALYYHESTKNYEKHTMTDKRENAQELGVKMAEHFLTEERMKT